MNQLQQDILSGFCYHKLQQKVCPKHIGLEEETKPYVSFTNGSA